MHEMIGIESTLSLFNGAQPHVVHVVMHWSQRGYRDTSTLAFDQKRVSTSVHVRVIIQTLDIESYVSNSHIGFDPDYEVIKKRDSLLTGLLSIGSLCLLSVSNKKSKESRLVFV